MSSFVLVEELFLSFFFKANMSWVCLHIHYGVCEASWPCSWQFANAVLLADLCLIVSCILQEDVVYQLQTTIEIRFLLF